MNNVCRIYLSLLFKMKTAFLFLTYDNFANPETIKEFTKDQNVYIHPKNPEAVETYFKKNVIKNLVTTEWGTKSIVDATLNLLEEAYSHPENEWFLLLPQDCVPIYTYEKFLNKLRKLSSNKSCFSVISHDKYWKTDQWWIMNREDAGIVLNTRFELSGKLIGAPDEHYFLSLLRRKNSDHPITDLKVMHSSFLKHTVQRSPMYFNKVLKHDIDTIKRMNSLFMRKVSSGFSLKAYNPKKKLFVVYIGTETNQNAIVFPVAFDVIIISAIKIELIRKDIVDKAIYVINIIYKFFHETVLNMCVEPYISSWDVVIFTTETFIIDSSNEIEPKKASLPYNKFYFNPLFKKLPNPKQFRYIRDVGGNLAFMLES